MAIWNFRKSEVVGRRSSVAGRWSVVNILLINVKKLPFIHVLTATRIDLPIENSKNDKKVILATITSTKCQRAAE